jgi:hypothetical protein
VEDGLAQAKENQPGWPSPTKKTATPMPEPRVGRRIRRILAGFREGVDGRFQWDPRRDLA